MPVEASAPSNIALIKYMGKTSSQTNSPTNASFSYTLEHLRSFVRIEESAAKDDAWISLAGYPELDLAISGQQKFLNFFGRLKKLWNIEGAFQIASANNFPSDCGLASSASSFAALTKAAYQLAQTQNSALDLSLEKISSVSRLGSGSSCRSFFSPWARWRGEGAEAVDLNLKLEHAVVIVEDAKKEVSSSEAHLRVTSSRLFTGRTQRAENRLTELEECLRKGEWRDAYEICWSEFWDMHALFETSRPNFGYMTGGSFEVLSRFRRMWKETKDGPLLTMDAGANIHLLLRPEQKASLTPWLEGLNVLKSWG